MSMPALHQKTMVNSVWLSCELSFFFSSYLHDLVSLLHPLRVGGAVWLNSAYKYPDVVSSHEPQPNAAVLCKRHGLKIRAVAESDVEEGFCENWWQINVAVKENTNNKQQTDAVPRVG